MPDANLLGMVGPVALLAVAALNLWLLRHGWAMLQPALLGPRASGTLVDSRPDGECLVLAFPKVAPAARRVVGAAPVPLAA
jgi:hypothetical protein